MCHNWYAAWQTHYGNKPVRPAAPVTLHRTGVDSLSEQKALDERETQYNQKMFEWHAEETRTFSTVWETFESTLLFEGGFLQDVRVDNKAVDMSLTDLDVEARASELAATRNKTIPQLFFLWQSMAQVGQRPQNVLELADILADETHRLYASFSKEELQGVLKSCRAAAIHIYSSRNRSSSLSPSPPKE